jgi:hypothetical protein
MNILRKALCGTSAPEATRFRAARNAFEFRIRNPRTRLTRDAMPHAMTEAFTVEEPPAGAAPGDGRTSGSMAIRQQECETHNERAMRAATAACKARSGGAGPRQQG